jgi:UDP-2,3-diacylglucosamine pyrophosphatase LpxH
MLRAGKSMTRKPGIATRVFVISDLHLGGPHPRMMSRPRVLAHFIEHVASMRPENEAVELVIAGDFVDFLAIEPQSSWTADPGEARSKLERTMRERPFDVVFKALGGLLGAGHRLTVLVGNHDVEMALPPVQDTFLAHLDAATERVRFVDDERVYRIGGALIEHGNCYDGANENDWAGLGAIAAALSRFEEPRTKLAVSAGSRLVEKVVNPLKSRYPFIDLLQPQGELLLLLVLAFEPQLLRRFDILVRLIRADRRQKKNPRAVRAGKTRSIAHLPLDDYDGELAAAFGQAYEQLRNPSPQPVGAGDLMGIAWTAGNDSLSEILGRGEPVPTERLRQLRVAMRKLIDPDHLRDDGDTGEYGKAAELIRSQSGGEIEVVVMGHTHLARHVGPSDRATYINTGTWADILRVPDEALVDGNDEALTEFLRGLIEDRRPGKELAPTYAELRIEASGAVSRAVLERWNP